MKFFKIIRKFILLIIVFGILYLTYTTYFISPTAYAITNETYTHQKINSSLNGLKIAYISDLNLNEKTGLKTLEKAINDLNKRPFDMVIFGGDLYDGKIFQSKDVSALLKKIVCKYGKFAILGDKDEDAKTETIQTLQNGGFEVLDNEVRTLYYKDTSLTLIAANDKSQIADFETNPKTIQLCVAHEPDTFANHKGKIDLQLSGHSYGGSIYIPYFGPLIPQDGAKIYNHGTYKEKGSTLIVSNGFSGPESFPYKLFSKNQILIVTLKTQTVEKS